jgi:hypothetical protein
VVALNRRPITLNKCQLELRQQPGDEIADHFSLVTTAQGAANDNDPVPRAANDNHPDAGVRVCDDLPRPVPVINGEGELVRKLLGEQFHEILLEGALS